MFPVRSYGRSALRSGLLFPRAAGSRATFPGRGVAYALSVACARSVHAALRLRLRRWWRWALRRPVILIAGWRAFHCAAPACECAAAAVSLRALGFSDAPTVVRAPVARYGVGDRKRSWGSSILCETSPRFQLFR